MLNKKGIATFAIAMWMLRFIFIAIVFLSIYFLVNFYSRIDFNTFNVEPDIYVQHMLYSPNGVSYYDAVSNRVYPGMIDLDNIGISRFNYSWHIGARVVIRDFNDKVLFEKTINPKTYVRKIESLPGPGGFDTRTKELYVLVKDNGEIIPARMEVEVVVQRI